MRLDKVNRLKDFGVHELERVAPENAQIAVDVKENPVGHFYALLKVRANQKDYFVKKESDSMYECFHKALRALKAQLAKQKHSQRVHRALKYQDA